MILIVGGEGAGKKEYALSLGYEEKDLLEARPGIDLAEIVQKNRMADGNAVQADGNAVQSGRLQSMASSLIIFHAERLGSSDPAETAKTADLLSGLPVVIANEVGSGIIPATKEERIARETAGRMTVLLAKKADVVVRLVCGIPMVIKGGSR